MNKVRTRIAPSPTGKFHIGTARTALFNYLFAKKNDGEFLLRWEDTDQERSTIESEEDIRAGLTWLGLNWDGEEFYQMKRLDIYKDFAEKLILLEEAYEKDGALWLKVKKGQKIAFKDLIKGSVEFSTDEFEDFVIVKSSGIPTFYFANAIDDHDMEITHVLRGDDHLTNTPKQIMINKVLGFNNPKFGHIPLILNEDKSKLSKRKNAVSVSEYKDKGYLPEAIINFLVLMGWNPGDNREYFTLEELVQEFSLERVQKSPAIWNLNKLDSINSHYIQSIETKELKNKITEVSKSASKMDDKLLVKAIEIVKSRLKYLSEFDELTEFLTKLPAYDAKILIFKKSDKDKTLRGLTAICSSLLAITDKEWDGVEKLNQVLLDVVEKEELDNGSVFWPVRVALSGLEKSPSPVELLWALGKEESLKRLELALKKLK